MTKDEFLSQLTHRLGYLPYEEVKKSVDFYREAIEDRVEDGATEEDAVAAMGGLDDVVREIEESLPLTTIMKQKVRGSKERSHSKTLWVVLAICGSPIWLALLISLFVVLLSVYIVVWAVIISLFAVLIALAASGAIIIAGGVLLPYGSLPPRLMFIGSGLICVGAGILLFPAIKYLSVKLAGLIPPFFRWVKRTIIGKKEAAQ